MLQDWLRQLLARRELFRMGIGSLAGLAGAGAISNTRGGQTVQAQQGTDHSANGHGRAGTSDHGNNMLIGQVDHAKNGFDPMQILVDWDYGTVSTLPTGQTLREYEVVAFDREIEIAPGLFFPAWTFNGRVPGPTIRCTEGDRIRIRFINAGTHPHTLHFHGIHPHEMDGVPGAGPGEIGVGETFTYEFDAEPFGCHHYHCHALPLKRHIHKGLYGAFIVDPKAGRPPAREFLMYMNAFDTNFDNENEIYAVNTVGFEYARRPIPVKVGELVRVYLINITEFDPINSFHLHAEFFDYYDHGTTLEPTLRTVDTIMQVQAQRGILEFRYRWPGQYMFHAHVSEFAELGWMGLFNVVSPEAFPAALATAGVDETWDEKATKGSTVAA
ncbi:MAG: multicopper oxidase domain-containing protein [Caldilineaceae bacterium]|nr:multicopper oxidase domain-containing protein [Caldilineaceae bacterium]